jgi:hypothetical protein
MKDSAKRPTDTINCPTCGNAIPITETFRRQLAEEAKAELEEQLTERKQALASKERELEAKQAEIQDTEKEIASRVAKQLAVEKAKLATEALTSARSEVSAQMRDLQSRAHENDKKLEAFEEKELRLLKEKRDLEDGKRSLELDVARRLDTERSGIREAALKEAAEQHRLKDSEKDQKLQQALKANEEMRRKLEQGPQQTQGEVLEIELEHLLRDHCPLDEILEVPKGVHGADVLQRVNSRSGLYCGLIIWEAKNTKKWNEGWIERLKENQRSAKADVAVIVSEAVPDGVDSFAFRDGVWVTRRHYVPALLMALRHTLSEVAQTKRAVASKNESIEVLFNYMTGPEFRHRVEAIASSFIKMKADLEKEKRTITKHWAKRAKQLDVIIVNTSGMYGDLQGLIGSPLRPIPALEDGESEEIGDLAAVSEEDGK